MREAISASSTQPYQLIDLKGVETVTTTSQNPVPAGPVIPLSPEVKTAYADLYNRIQAALDNTMNLALIQALNQWQPQVDQVLTMDDEYTLKKDTAIFVALQKQIKDVNIGLATLRSQISAISSHFAMAADIIAAIDKVLTLVPGFQA